MKISRLKLEDLIEVVPDKKLDDRGFFSEVFNGDRLREWGLNLSFVQDNHSYSRATGVIRGLHYQIFPREQGKLVRVTKGRIYDVAVDIRPQSSSFGQWASIELSAASWNQLFIPSGFAHGFMTLEADTEVQYKVTEYYSPEHDRSIRYDDPEIGITWPNIGSVYLLSTRDRNAPFFKDAQLGRA